MTPEDFKKLIAGLSERDLTSDEPHVSMRCEENNLQLGEIKNTLLGRGPDIVRLVEDRPKVYKLYYRLSTNTELKVIVDILTYRKINIRTVRKLSRKFRIGRIKRQRF